MTGNLAAAAWATVDVMTSVLPSVYIGLFLAAFLGRRGIGPGRRLLPLVAAVSGLPPACALSVLLAMGDRTAGMAAVAVAREQAGLTDREVVAANLVAKAPSVLQFFVFSFIPIMTAIYPTAIAVRFLVIYFAAFTAISLVGVILARWRRRPAGHCPAPAITETAVASSQAAARAALTETFRPFISMVLWMAGMTFVAMLFIKAGWLQRLADYLPVLARLGLDAGVLPLAGAGLVSMIGGVAAVGAALRDGAVPAAMVVPLLLTISLLHNFYDFFASSLPRAVGVFGHRLGVKVALAGFAVTQAVMLIMLVLAAKSII
jgi:hypothetical protein